MVKRWWLKVALALLLCAMWSALGTGVRAQGTVPPVSLSAEEQRLIESIECVSLEGQQYCYGLGFVALEMKSPAWYSYWAEVLRGGDANAAYVKQVLTQRQALNAEAKRLRDAQELEAMRGKAKLLGQVDALTAKETVEVENPDIPRRAVIMEGYFRQQETFYWCGPATMESIADADGFDRTQSWWANELGTTQNGTSLYAIVTHINSHTRWDDNPEVGDYAIISVRGRTLSWFINFYRLHLGVGRAPIVNHVEYYALPYVEGTCNRDGGCGHYQTSRGYDVDQGVVMIFEPYNGSGKAAAGPKSIKWQELYDAINARYGWIGG